MYGVKEFVSNVLAVENVPESLILELESLKTDDHSNKICDYLLDKDAQFLFMAYSRAIGVAKEQFLTHCKSFGNSIFQEVIYQIITYIGLNICYSESELVNIIISALQISNTLYQHPASEETALSILKSLVERFKEEEHERNLIFNLISKQIIREIDNTESIMATSRTSKIADIIFILISHDKGTLLKKEFDLSSNMLTKLFSIIITPPNFFPNPNENGAFLAKDVNDAQYTIRTAMRLFHDQMHSLMLPLVKDVDSREKIMLWLSQIADSNVNRMKIQCDPRTISPDSLVYNILGVLQRLSRPFLDSNHSKMSLISTTNFYFRTRFDIDPTTTRLISSEQSLNFATKVVRSISNYTEIARRTREINSFIEGNSNDPRMGIARTQLNSMNTSRIAIESLILDQDIMEDSWALIDVLCHWLSTISISNLGFNTKTDAASALSDLQESNSNTESDTATVYQDCENFLRFLPEYYVESIGEWLLFALRLAPRTFWGKRDCGHVLRFLCSHLDKPKYIKSPHLRAKFVDVLFGLLIYDVSPDDEESTSLNTQIIPNAPCTLDDAIKEQLPVALMRFYVEVEVTGASSQFYDKFNIRHVISAIFLRLLSAPECVDAITSVGTDDIFLRFTNLLLNDATYLLDEAMTKLSMIHDFEQSPTPPQPDQANEQQRVERQCESYLLLSNSTLRLMDMMCSLSQIKELFTRPIVLPRLAAMLAFNLSLLCGPKAANLKIKDPRRLHWNPRSLLSRIVSLFIALGDNFDFISALVSDTRSFTPETMQRATVTLKKHAIRSEADIKRLEDLALKISSIKMTSKEEPENIPDEFLDPLLYTLMRDPVILSKTSRVTVDRTTITAHLLNDPTDPFNRQPVSPEDLIPDTDLKTRIESFLSSTKN